MRRATRIIAVAVVTIVLCAAVSEAQQRWWRWEPRLATPDDFDGAFHDCRAMYQSNRNGVGGGWATDYPDADVNLSIRLSELTRTRVSRNASGAPNHLIVRLTDDELFQCPFHDAGGRRALHR